MNDDSCRHEWETVKVCSPGYDLPLASGTRDLTGGFCYGNDPYACNSSVEKTRCKKCGVEKQ